MKYLPLIYRNVMRNKIRSLFTGASIAISLFLVVTLHSLLASQDEITERTKVHNRVAVLHEAGLAGRVPIAYVDRVRKVPGVACAAPMSWFGGNYREEKVQFPQFATDPKEIFRVYEEYTIPPDQLKAWEADKAGCVVGATIARNKGWNIGDKIALQGNIYPVNLEFKVCGIYDGPATADKEWLLFNFTYLDDKLKEGNHEARAGNAGIIMLRAASAEAIPTVMQTIESSFASSDAPVKPMTEKQFAQSFTEMMGNVKGFIRYTSMAVVAALLCVAANTMAMSLRERTREIALLKAIGFSQSTVLGMFLSESVLIGLMGGVLGALGGKLLFASIDLSKVAPGLGLFYIPWTTALAGLALSAAIGFFSGVIPSWRAARLSVVNGLRKVV